MATRFCFRTRYASAHRRFEPIGIGVILNAAPAAVAVVHQIRRVGEDEIDAVCRHLAHGLDAVALKDRVDWKLLDRIRVHDVHSVLCGLPVNRGTPARSDAPPGEWVRLPRPRDAFREGPEESFRALSRENFVWRGTGKAEARRAAGRRLNPERVLDSTETAPGVF